MTKLKKSKEKQEIVLPIVATILARSVTVVQKAFVHIQAVTLCHRDNRFYKYDDDGENDDDDDDGDDDPGTL